MWHGKNFLYNIFLDLKPLHLQEDPLEKDMATHSGILAWRIPWMEGLGGLQSTGRKELDTTERLHFT